MNVLSRVMEVLKGTLDEVGEAIMDSQAIRILDKEIREASEDVKHSKKKLNELIARQIVAEEKVEQLTVKIEEHEDYAKQALKKEDQNLAHDIASVIADMELDKKKQSQDAELYRHKVYNLKEGIQQAELDLLRMKQQVDTVRATASMQKAQQAVSVRKGGDKEKLQTALDALERIKQRQQGKQKQTTSDNGGQTSAMDLEQRLQAAGIKPRENSAEAVLNRLNKTED